MPRPARRASTARSTARTTPSSRLPLRLCDLCEARWADYTPTQWSHDSHSPWPEGSLPLCCLCLVVLCAG